MRDWWSDTSLVVDTYLNEPSTYGPFDVADEAARENTVATIHIGESFLLLCE